MYVTPTAKIVGRFSSETFSYLKSGKNIGMAPEAFPAYYAYNRRLIPTYTASKPWIAHFAFRRFETLIRPDMTVLEFGSGGIMLFFSEKVVSIYSIEHDQVWYRKIHQALQKCPSVQHVLVEPERTEGPESCKSVHGLFPKD